MLKLYTLYSDKYLNLVNCRIIDTYGQGWTNLPEAIPTRTQ